MNKSIKIIYRDWRESKIKEKYGNIKDGIKKLNEEIWLLPINVK